MATMEKLFVQIFDKKRWIIEHLKQQKQVYDQHLASKLLIQGIPPPSWLLNPEFPSLALDFTVINKEELISELLLQRPGPLVSYPGGTCFSYDKSVATAVNDEPQYETCAKTCASSNDSEGNDPSIVPSCHINGSEDGTDILPPCLVDGTKDMFNYVPMSPEDQINTTNSNTYLKLEKSLAKMQRSRSRQKALELRNSGRASGKSCLGNENSVGIRSGNKTLGYHQPLDGIRKSVELIGPSVLSAGINEEAALGDCSGKETRNDVCSDSSSQSKCNGTKEAQTEDDAKMERQSNFHGGRNTRSRSCCPQSIIDSHENDRKIHAVYVGRMTRSRSGKAQLAEIDDPKNRRITLSRSCHTTNGNGIVMNSNLNSVRTTKSRSCGAKEAETKDQRSRTKNDMVVEPKQLDFDDLEDTCLADIPTEDRGNLEENTRVCYIKDKSASLPCAPSFKRTSKKYKSLAYETQNVQIEVRRSLSKTEGVSGPTSSLVDYLPNSLGTQKKIHGITMECAAEPSFSRPNIDIAKGLSAQKHIFEPEEGQELNKDTSCFSLPNVDTEVTTSLHGDTVEATLSIAKTRHEMSSSNDCKDKTYLSLPNAVEPTMSLQKEAVEANLSPVTTTHEASCVSDCQVTLSLPNAATEATVNLNRNAVDTIISPDQTRLESSSGNDVKEPLETQIMELVRLSPHRASPGSLASMLNFLPVNSLDETISVHSSEMLKSGNQFRNTDKQTSCFSSHVEVVGSKLPEVQEEVDILPEYNVSNAIDGSWPCYKRRKIGYQVHNKSASPSARVHTFPGVKRSFSNKFLDCVKDNSSPNSPKLIISQESDAISNSEFVASATNGVKYLDSIKLELGPKVQHEEAKVTLGGSVIMPFACEQKELSTSRVSNVKQDATTEPSNCFSDGEVREASTSAEHSSRRLCNELGLAKSDGQGSSTEKLTLTKAILDIKESLRDVEKLNFSIASPLIERMDVDEADADEIVPELEGFIIAENRESLHNAEDELNGIISSLSEQAEFTSLSEQVHRPASLSTPVSPFPTGYKPHFTPGVFRSVPNGLIENVDLTSNLLSDDHALHVKSYSDFSVTSKRFGWDTAKSFLSPLVKGFEGIISKSGGSNEQLSSNPELICFPIQEDPETSEEDVDLNDVSDTGMNGVDQNLKRSLIREPLCDITEDNESILPCSQEVNRGSFESVTTEISIGEKCDKDKKKSEMHLRSRQARQEKENKSLSIGANSTRKHSESLSSRYSKPKLSGKSSLRSRGQSLSKKEPKPNNIVSNVKSFIPLVQQKKAISDIPAKREVKVKALEAAEAAKRVEEKRENERKQKKEALKLERARLEQENLKQMELKKRLKEEERKKRDAENAAKKRQREEDERKEKERKRRRLEDVRCQQKQAEEKIQAWRDECQTEDARAHVRKDSNDKAAEKEHISRNPVNELVLGDTKEAINEAASTNDNKSSTGSSDAGKVGCIDVSEISTPNCDKTDKLINQTSQEQSYDISPYQCSDDEEEEEDDIPNKKFIPTWASKSCVAGALSSLKNLDSDTIFPPGSFCSLEEVLLPRRLPQK